MMNSKYTQIKSLWKNKQILTEAAIDWKQSYGCFPSVGEFTAFINECLGEAVLLSDETREINENDISRFASTLAVLSEDAADKFAGMSDTQFEDWVKSNKGGEAKARKLRAEGQARKTGGTATAEPPKTKPAPETPKTEAPKSRPAAEGPTDPKARAEWAKASQEEVRRAQAERARQQWAHNKPGAGTAKPQGAPKAEAPKAAPKAEAPKAQAKPATPVVPEVDKAGKFIRGAGKFVLAVPPVAVAAEAGQQLFGMGAEALDAGPVGKFGSETAGVYYGEKGGIKLVDVGLKKAGFRPTGFKPTVAGAGLMVGGQKAGEAIGGEWSPAIGAMGGALVGEVGERAVMKTAAAQAVKSGVEKIAAKTVGKSLAKKIPGVGLVAGGLLAAERASGGDWVGAAGEALSGLASTVPGLGTLASAGIDTALAAKDISAETEKAEEQAQAEAQKKENEKLKAAMKSPTSQAASFERALYGGAPLREGWLSALIKPLIKTATKEAGEAALKTTTKEAEETALKTAVKELPVKPATIEMPVTHPIVKVEPATPKPAAKPGEIVKAETKIETRPIKAPETTSPAAQTLPANATKTPEQVIVDIVNKVKDVLKATTKNADIVKPKADDLPKPKGDDIVKPKGDDIVKPKGDDIVKPKGDDIVKPKGDDVVKPKGDDVVKPKGDGPPKPKGDGPPKPKGDGPPKPKGDGPPKPKGDGPPKPKGDGPPIPKPKFPRDQQPQISTSLAAEPEVPLELAPGERFGVRKRAATYDPFRRMFTTQSVYVSEGKLSPKESLQRKLSKQKYKVSYLQDGKKVEVFASSIRGVRRVVYGKKQYRVHNTSGSDVTGYFKKLLGQ